MEGCLRLLSCCQDEVVEVLLLHVLTDLKVRRGPFDHPVCTLCVGTRFSSIYS